MTKNKFGEFTLEEYICNAGWIAYQLALKEGLVHGVDYHINHAMYLKEIALCMGEQYG